MGAWQRTGVITFDGNKKLEKEAMFKKGQKRLEEYGSVAQLCIVKNKRRSTERYCSKRSSKASKERV